VKSIDLHCDLLSYLRFDPKRTPFDPRSLCSAHQLKAGGVALQVMAVYTTTCPWSSRIGAEQIEIFRQLPIRYPDAFCLYEGELNDKVSILCAIENASALCEETEPLQQGLDRFHELVNTTRCFYVSLTWNEENRFGGGAESAVGLKEDGKRFLEAMSLYGIPLDLSHTSDALAFEALTFIDQRALNIPILASHSNFRALCNERRNLPDELAQEIIRRGGIIGLVAYRKFLSPATMEGFADQVEYGLKLGAGKALALGSDFFCMEDFAELNHGFVVENAGELPHLLAVVEKRGVDPTLFFENAKRFVEREG
jgi:membrane dipeptidase